MIGVPFFYYLITMIMGAYDYVPNGTSISQTPGFWYSSGLVLSLNPLVAMGISEAFYLMGHPLFMYTRDDLLAGETLFVISPWLLFCFLAVLISAVLITLSVQFVKPVRYKRRGVYDYEPGGRTPVSPAPDDSPTPAQT
jgi:hypothetical protein